MKLPESICQLNEEKELNPLVDPLEISHKIFPVYEKIFLDLRSAGPMVSPSSVSLSVHLSVLPSVRSQFLSRTVH